MSRNVPISTWRHVPLHRVASTAMRTAEPGMHVPSTRGRKRKNPLQPSAWDPASAARSNMPRASGMPGQQTPIVKRPYYNLVFGTEQDEDVADSLVGTLTDSQQTRST